MKNYQQELKSNLSLYLDSVDFDIKLKAGLSNILNSIIQDLKDNQAKSLKVTKDAALSIRNRILAILEGEKSKYLSALQSIEREINNLEDKYSLFSKNIVLAKIEACLDKATFDESSYRLGTKDYCLELEKKSRDLIFNIHIYQYLEKLILDIKKQYNVDFLKRITSLRDTNYRASKFCIDSVLKKTKIDPIVRGDIDKFFSQIINASSFYAKLYFQRASLEYDICSNIKAKHKPTDILLNNFYKSLSLPELEDAKGESYFDYDKDVFYIGNQKRDSKYDIPYTFNFSKIPIILYGEGQSDKVASILSSSIYQLLLTMAPSPGVNFSLFSPEDDIQRFDGEFASQVYAKKWKDDFGSHKRKSFVGKYNKDEYRDFCDRINSRYNATENFSDYNARNKIKMPYEFVAFLLADSIDNSYIDFFKRISQFYRNHGFLPFMAVHTSKKEELLAKLKINPTEFQLFNLSDIVSKKIEIRSSMELADFSDKDNSYVKCRNFIKDNIFADNKMTTSDVVIKYGFVPDGDFSLTYRLDAYNTSIIAKAGFGKSTLLTYILKSILKYDAEHTQVYIFDFKYGSGFSNFTNIKNISFLYSGVEAAEILNSTLKSILDEMQKRISLYGKYNKKSAVELNTAIDKGEIKGIKRLPRIFILIDEFQVILNINSDTNELKNSIKSRLKSITELGRSSAIHLIFASQANDNKGNSDAEGIVQTTLGFHLYDNINGITAVKAKIGESEVTEFQFDLEYQYGNAINDIFKLPNLQIDDDYKPYSFIINDNKTFLEPSKYPNFDTLVNGFTSSKNFKLACGVSVDNYKEILNIPFVKTQNNHLLIQGESFDDEKNLPARHFWNMLLFSFSKWENPSKKMIILDQNNILDGNSSFIKGNVNINYYNRPNEAFCSDFNEWYALGKSEDTASDKNIFFVMLGAESSLNIEIAINSGETEEGAKADDSAKNPSEDPTETEMLAYLSPNHFKNIENSIKRKLEFSEKLNIYKNIKSKREGLEKESNAIIKAQKSLGDVKKNSLKELLKVGLSEFSTHGAYLILSTSAPSYLIKNIYKDNMVMPNMFRVVSFNYNAGEKVNLNYPPIESYIFGAYQVPRDGARRSLFYPFNLTINEKSHECRY